MPSPLCRAPAAGCRDGKSLSRGSISSTQLRSMKTIPTLATKLLIYLLLGIALVFVLIVLQQLLVPVFFAVLFAYLLYPAAKCLEQKGVPRILANLILIVSTVLV